MVASIGPFWDANETWLVLGVGILLVAFPRAHGVVLGALYLPVAVMLVGLMLRGVAFEFRVKARAGTASCGTGCSGPARSSPSFCAGLDARALHHRLRARGFGYWLFALRRRREPVRRLRAAGRDLADPEDRGRRCRRRRSPGRAGACCGSRSAWRW